VGGCYIPTRNGEVKRIQFCFEHRPETKGLLDDMSLPHLEKKESKLSRWSRDRKLPAKKKEKKSVPTDWGVPVSGNDDEAFAASKIGASDQTGYYKKPAWADSAPVIGIDPGAAVNVPITVSGDTTKLAEKAVAKLKKMFEEEQKKPGTPVVMTPMSQVAKKKPRRKKKRKKSKGRVVEL
jgi:hypothetical protein